MIQETVLRIKITIKKSTMRIKIKILLLFDME